MAQYKGAAVESYRAVKLAAKRKLQQNEAEFQKKKIEENMRVDKIMDKKFSSQSSESRMEMDAVNDTVGLVTMAQMKAKQEELKHALERAKCASIEQPQSNLESKEIRKFRQQRQIKALSFDFDDEERDFEDGRAVSNNSYCDNEQPVCKKKIKKNPEVDTSYLPDRRREEEEYRMRMELKHEWLEKQKAIKAETINITFSYWDGSGHRFNIKMLKGDSIFDFLHRSLTDILRLEFSELRTISADQLMYIKEDLILPQYYTFYDFIVSKARGKSGPLFQFDVKDDIRLVSDATVEKEESHAGKVVLRSWYERNKHIFPGNRWEPFDPSKTYITYTFKDKRPIL